MEDLQTTGRTNERNDEQSGEETDVALHFMLSALVVECD